MTLPERLAHLPDRKRRELERVAAILFDEFDDALKTKLSMKGKRGRILKLILFAHSLIHRFTQSLKSTTADSRIHLAAPPAKLLTVYR